MVAYKTVFKTIIFIVLALSLSVTCFADEDGTEDSGAAADTFNVPLTASINNDIVFGKPGWTNKSYAVVKVFFTVEPDTVYARTEYDNEWIDITADKAFKITKDGLLYVKFITGGVEAVQSDYISQSIRLQSVFSVCVLTCRLCFKLSSVPAEKFHFLRSV